MGKTVEIVIAVHFILLVSGSQVTKYSVDEGTNIHVTCNVTDSPDIEVWWTKNETDSSFSQSGIELYIQNISRTQAGIYICHAHNNTTPSGEVENNETLTTVNIDVRYPATILSVNITPIKITEGDEFNVSCQLTGNPPPAYSIKNNDTGKVYIQGSNATKISVSSFPADCLDTGTIVCTAKNDLNVVNSSQSIKLVVYCTPKMDPRKANTTKHTVYARLRADTAAEAHVIGYPNPSFTWSFHDKVLPSDRQVNLAHSTILLFNNVSVSDYGPYILNMSNSVGSRTETFTLTPTGPPEMPKDFTAHNVTSSSATLSWTSGYDYGAVQTFYVWNFRGKDADILAKFKGSSYNNGIGYVIHNVTGLKSATNYSLTISAVNALGIGAVSPWFVYIHTEAGTPGSTTPGSDVAVIAGSTAGGVVFLVVLVIVAVVVYKKRRRYEKM